MGGGQGTFSNLCWSSTNILQFADCFFQHPLWHIIQPRVFMVAQSAYAAPNS